MNSYVLPGVLSWFRASCLTSLTLSSLHVIQQWPLLGLLSADTFISVSCSRRFTEARTTFCLLLASRKTSAISHIGKRTLKLVVSSHWKSLKWDEELLSNLASVTPRVWSRSPLESGFWLGVGVFLLKDTPGTVLRPTPYLYIELSMLVHGFGRCAVHFLRI